MDELGVGVTGIDYFLSGLPTFLEIEGPHEELYDLQQELGIPAQTFNTIPRLTLENVDEIIKTLKSKNLN